MSQEPIDTSLTFEQAMNELDAIVQTLEKGAVDLEKAIDLYARGEALRLYCEKKLQDAQLKIEKIVVDKSGTVSGYEEVNLQHFTGAEGRE